MKFTVGTLTYAVVRKTPTQVVARTEHGDERRFRLSDGQLLGGGGMARWLDQIDPADLARVRTWPFVKEK